MAVKWLTIQSGITMAHQKSIVEFNQHYPKKSKSFANIHAHSKKIRLLLNEPAIKNTEAGSVEQEKNVLIKGFGAIPPGTTIKNNERFETVWINNSYLYPGNNLIDR